MQKIYNDIIANSKINLGHNNLKLKKSWHINLSKYYLGDRNNTVIFDYKFTYTYLIKALCVLAAIVRSQGNVLIINTNPELSKLMYHVKKNVKNENIFFSDCGWTKGTLTNWNKVFNKVKTFVDFYYDYNTFLNENNIHFPSYKKMKKNYKGFISDVASRKNTKTAIAKNDRNSRRISSLPPILAAWPAKMNNTKLNLNWKPDLLIFTSINNSEAIFKEASALNIPTIAFIDSNSNIYDVIYPIPANINFYPLVWFFLTLATKIVNR